MCDVTSQARSRRIELDHGAFQSRSVGVGQKVIVLFEFLLWAQVVGG